MTTRTSTSIVKVTTLMENTVCTNLMAPTAWSSTSPTTKLASKLSSIEMVSPSIPTVQPATSRSPIGVTKVPKNTTTDS
nr:unnamed protein product [Callosobruchus chinensis]